jgi:hypothetical protein
MARRTRNTAAIAFVLAVLALGLGLKTIAITRTSPTFDEPSHLINGVYYHQNGSWFDEDRHPPLFPRLIGAVSPLLGHFADTRSFIGDPKRFENKYSYRLDLFSGLSGDLAVQRLRWFFQLFWAVTCVSLVLIARRLGAPEPGLYLLVGLLALDPFWASFSSMASNDFLAMSFGAAAVALGLECAARGRRRVAAVVAFAAFSAAWATKLTTALLAAPLALGLALGQLPLWLAGSWAAGLAGGVALSHGLGHPEFFRSVHESAVRETSFLGRSYQAPPLSYFPLVALAKCTMAALLAAAIGLVREWRVRVRAKGLVRRARARPGTVTAVTLVVSLVLCSFILPGLGARLVAPLMLASWVALAFAVRDRRVALGLVALLACESLRFHDSLLASRLAVLSSDPTPVDIGQAVGELARWRTAHPDGRLAVSLFGGTWPEIYGLTEYDALPSFPPIGRRPLLHGGSRFQGYLAVSRNFLDGYGINEPYARRLKDVTPLECLQRVLCLYDFR